MTIDYLFPGGGVLTKKTSSCRYSSRKTLSSTSKTRELADAAFDAHHVDRADHRRTRDVVAEPELAGSAQQRRQRGHLAALGGGRR